MEPRHPHAAHDRTREWRSCCHEIFLGRDPKRQRLNVEDDRESEGQNFGARAGGCGEVLGGGCWAAPGYLAIDMTLNGNNQQNEAANMDSWMSTAMAMSASIDEVSQMIRQKAASYVSSTDALDICFGREQEAGGEGTMTNADRSILETAAASFSAGMAKQIDSLRQAATPEGDAAADPHQWATGPVGHRAAIASCLMQRLKSEIMEPMTHLQSQREKAASQSVHSLAGDGALEIAQNPMRLFRTRAWGDSTRRSLPPAQWEVGEHDAETDRREREQEKDEFLGVYGKEKEEGDEAGAGDVAANLLPPSSVMRFMNLPKPTLEERGIVAPQNTAQPTQQPRPRNVPPPSYEKEEQHRDQLHRESAMLLATYQTSELDSVQKVEQSMVAITTLLSRFTDLITEQQEDIFAIHDGAVKSKENVDKGQDNLVDAADRGAKSRHPMASFIVLMALLLLFFNWILP
ncbi:hypothetical protein ACHAXT_012016 [Thalassiosira profunda]